MYVTFVMLKVLLVERLLLLSGNSLYQMCNNVHVKHIKHTYKHYVGGCAILIV